MMKEISLDEVLGWVDLPYVDGALPDAEARVLLDIVRMERPRMVLEIGTYMGATTRRLAEAVRGWGGWVITVDLPQGMWRSAPDMGWTDWHLIETRDVGREFRGRECEKWITQIWADTREWDWGKSRWWADFIFIDGSHTYEYCRNDSEKSLEVLAVGGTIIWHDADEQHPGVMRLLEEWDVPRIKGTRLGYYKYR
jgi:predicted O-methyltransferase YrrM